MPRTIVLDCDPGVDDAVALFLAQGSPEIELAAVTTVGGNQSLAAVTHNARGLAAFAGVTAPVAAGCDRPLIRPLAVSTAHGAGGLGGAQAPERGVDLDPRHAVDVIVDTVMSRTPGEVTLVPIGPLTNIAAALHREPRLVDRVAEVVLMGGAVWTGNRTPVSEFNIGVDPEAAHVVFSAGWPVTMVGLDLTFQALATDEVCARIAAIGGPLPELVLDMLSTYREVYRESRGFPGPPLHDACAVAYVIDRAVMTTRRAPIAVELTGTHTLGMTVADLRRPAPPDCPTQVALDLDVDRFWDLVVDALTTVAAATRSRPEPPGPPEQTAPVP